MRLDSGGHDAYRRHMTKTLSVIALALIALGSGRQPTLPGSIGTQIVAEPMGTDHEAVYFHKLLNDHLTRAGYAGPDRPKERLVLVTTLSTPVVGGETRAYATAELRTSDGRVLWTDDFPQS